MPLMQLDVYKRQVLSCSVLAARADGKRVTTLEGLQEEAAEFGAFIADQGAEPVSYTHLDVYKRQKLLRGLLCRLFGIKKSPKENL